MAIEKSQLKAMLDELSRLRGRHTELVSVYVPTGYNINEIGALIKQEQSTASNIKSKTTRKNVLSALEKVAGRLKHYNVTPPNGLVLLCGNVSRVEGKAEIKLWEFEPPEPIVTRVYRCDQTFVLAPLEDMIREREVYGLVVLDTSEAAIGFLKGKSLVLAKKLTSLVPGKQIKGGQCLVPETLIQKDDGEIVKIADIHNPSAIKAVNFDDFTTTKSKVLDRWETRKEKIYKITTKCPRIELQASKDHTFFVWAPEGIKEIAAENLKEGHYLLMSEKIRIRGNIQLLTTSPYTWFEISAMGLSVLKEIRKKRGMSQKQLAAQLGIYQADISRFERGCWPIKREVLTKLCAALKIDSKRFIRQYCKPPYVKLPKEINASFAQILGYFVGDGSFDTNKICFHESDLEVARSYKNKINRLFGIKCTLKFRRNKNYWLLRAYSLPLVQLLKEEFPEIKSSKESLIPTKILKSPDIIVASFLRGFFDAEGYVSRGRLALGITNKLLAQQIQLCLLRFGIISSILEYDSARNPYSKEHRFTIDITEKESLEKFNKSISLSSPRKKALLIGTIKKKATTSRVRQIVVHGAAIRQIVKRHGLNLEHFPTVTNFFRNERQMSKSVFKRSILDQVKNKKDLYKKLRRILSYEVLPVKISHISIKEGQSRMVDISTGSQNFIANGLIVHNSAARFARVREGLLLSWKKEVGEVATKIFSQEKDLKNIIIGGPGMVKDDFAAGPFLPEDLKKKILGVKDLGYSGEEGMRELIERAQDLLKEAAVYKEKQLLQRFFEHLQKDTGLAIYGKTETKKALEQGAVETLIISEKISSEIVEPLTASAKQTGASVEIVSAETPEGAQFFTLGGIGGILRFRIE